MSQAMPRKVSIDSHKVAELIFDRIFPAIHGEPTDAVVLSLIGAATLAMRPHLPTEKLQQVILDASGYLITLLQDEVPAEEAN